MRITGGEFRSRALEAPRGQATRPTSDRVREALFAILGSLQAFRGLRVLDLYAGTGALAFEALSRGASHATLVESARPALQAIHTNATKLGLAGRLEVVSSTVERAVSPLRDAPPFDLAFADPPYADVGSGVAPRAVATLLAGVALTPRFRLVFEHAKGDASPEVGRLRLSDSRRYGDTVLSFYGPGELPQR